MCLVSGYLDQIEALAELLAALVENDTVLVQVLCLSNDDLGALKAGRHTPTTEALLLLLHRVEALTT